MVGVEFAVLGMIPSDMAIFRYLFLAGFLAAFSIAGAGCDVKFSERDIRISPPEGTESDGPGGLLKDTGMFEEFTGAGPAGEEE